ncbi:4'-phosphopantetheinyl transferase superfamily protein [Streptococcus mutans]|nr:4'-phosphopantetheinyl transferase superfamily protein [Streptococcus mutans]MCB5033862.1 4'-phosphopantetheinyl transferase superfamily protein [Streptococcus mutans]MCB5121762.1 4'-phosphopantetheinyl transferase superfamily protein [Streptococcus mutans]
MKIFKIRSQKPLEDRMFFSLLELIEEEDRKQILRYQFWQDRQRSLLGHLLSRYAIIQEYALTNKEIQIRRHAYGKPYIKDYSQIHYNISHSGEWIVCVVDSSSVGIDIQEHRGAKNDLAKYYFSPREQNYLFSLEKDEQSVAFYDLWSMKEAYIKATGKGLSQPLNEFSVAQEEEGFCSVVEKERRYFLRQYKIENGYSLAVCSQTGWFCSDLRELTIEAILPAFKENRC